MPNNPNLQADIVSGFFQIFDALKAPSPAHRKALQGKRIAYGLGLGWFLHLKIDSSFRPSRMKVSKLYKPLGIHLASLYELCRQADTGDAHGLFLECLLCMMGESIEPTDSIDHSKKGYVQEARGSIQALADEILCEPDIPRDLSPILWLMQRSAREADSSDRWGRRYWYSSQRRSWPPDATPFLNSWEKWLRHIEREPGLSIASIRGDDLVFLRRGGSYRAVQIPK